MPRLTADAATVGFADLAARVMGFLASVHMASTLGREGFGAITVGLSVLSYSIWFADLGLGALGARETARPPVGRRFMPATIASARFLSPLAVIAIGGLATLFVDGPIRRPLLLFFVLSVFPALLSIEWLHQGRRRFVPVAVGRVVNGSIFLAGTLLFISSTHDIERVPLVYGAGFLGAAILLLCIPRGGERIIPRGNEWREIAPAWRTAAAIGIGGLFAQSVQLFPPIALGWFSTDQAGLLGAATKITFAALMVDRVFGALFLPALSSLWIRDRDAAARNLQIVLRLMIATAFLAATLITVLARPSMSLVFGADYIDGDSSLFVLGWFVAATLVNSFFSFGLIAAGSEKAYLRATIIGGCAAVAASIPLAWSMGSIGAALGMLIGESALVLAAGQAFRQHISLAITRPLVVASAVSALVIVPLRIAEVDSFWLLVATPPFYLFLLVLGGGLHLDDLRWPLKQ